MISPTILSIGLFVYNGAMFLSETLDSLLGQTFRDFELIISDNGSSDITQQICERYAAVDARIRYYRNNTNMGAGWNVRRVLSLATGRYFKWAACDDLYEPIFLARCIEALESDPSFVLAHANTRVIDGQGKVIGDYHWPMQTDSANTVTRFREMLLNDHLCYQIFGVIRREALLRIPPQGSYVNSDGVLLAQLSFLGRFYQDPERLFISRRHTRQSSQTLPLRLKNRRFRLTNRYGTLPCPEWWDPNKAKSIQFPEWRQLREYYGSILRAPIRSIERFQSLALLAPWIVKHFRRMMKDILLAADQVLYNLQMSSTSEAELKEIRRST
jgi:glycosyltransferase involved in cell wall biosynthesis